MDLFLVRGLHERQLGLLRFRFLVDEILRLLVLPPTPRLRLVADSIHRLVFFSQPFLVDIFLLFMDIVGLRGIGLPEFPRMALQGLPQEPYQ